MKYLQNKPFSVGPSDSAEANKRYADNWEAIFGPKAKEEATADTDEGFFREGAGEDIE